MTLKRANCQIKYALKDFLLFVEEQDQREDGRDSVHDEPNGHRGLDWAVVFVVESDDDHGNIGDHKDAKDGKNCGCEKTSALSEYGISMAPFCESVFALPSFLRIWETWSRTISNRVLTRRSLLSG